MTASVSILGSLYEIERRDRQQDPQLKNALGYCDWTLRLIVVGWPSEGDTLGDLERAVRETLRHEIIHAFLYESGMEGSMAHPELGHDEQMVDWIAMQWQKLHRAFDEAGALDP